VQHAHQHLTAAAVYTSHSWAGPWIEPTHCCTSLMLRFDCCRIQMSGSVVLL
jgi:hypothetical protein